MEEREENKLAHLFMGDLEMEPETGKRYHASLNLYILECACVSFLGFCVCGVFTSLSEAGLLLWSVCRPSMAE